MIQYQFTGQRRNERDDSLSTARTLRPVYGDKCALKYTMADNTRYYKPSWVDSLQFIRDDYDWIMSEIDNATRFEVTYLIDVKWKHVDDDSWADLCTLQFAFTDCEVDADNGIISVRPSVKSVYNDIEDGKDREFNLVELEPQINNLFWYKRVLSQVYVVGEDIVTNIIGGMHWEQEVEDSSVTLEDLYNNYHFTPREAYNEVEVDGLSSGGGNGTYFGIGSTNRTTYEYLVYPVGIKPYQIRFKRWLDVGTYLFRISIEDTNGVEKYYRQYSEGSATNYPADTATVQMLDADTGQATNVFVSYSVKRIYDRLLCDVDTGVDRPTDDLVEYSSNYRYIAQYANFVYSYSTTLSLTPTQWGSVRGSNKYYTAPTAVSGAWMPIGQSLWNNVSLFLDLNSGMQISTEQSLMRTMTLRHAYPLWSALAVLLAEVAPDVTFEPLEGYSEFLFSDTNPVTGHDNLTLFITPKSNITNGDYKTPAYKAPITLASVLDMLRNIFQLYWYIDGQGRFHLEHISWFMNGGTYSTPSPTVSYDLTALRNTRNGKAWAFATSRYTFAKSEMPATISWKWMDDVTEPFTGYEMLFISPLVTLGKNEEKTIGDFTSDIDYVALQPGDVSQDGFMLLGAEYISEKEVYQLPFYPYRPSASAPITNLQNGYLAMAYLEKQTYWLDNQPAGGIIYGDGTTATTHKQSRTMQQDVVVPMASPDLDPLTLIRTDIGDGEIKDVEINLSSLTAKAKLRYDTVQ
jgi:hypothetical protein